MQHSEILRKTATNPFKQLEVLVFGSNIDTHLKVKIVKDQLQGLAGVQNVSVDLEDWERVLRVECNPVTIPEMVVAKLKSMGFKCYELVG